MKTRKHLKHLILSAAVACLLATTQAHAIIIDDFDDGNSAVVNYIVAGPTDLRGPLNTPSSAVGDSRTLEILTPSPSTTFPNPGPDTTATLGVSGGVLNHGSVGPDTTSSQVIWDANSAGLGGVNLTGTGPDINVSILSIDSGSVDLTFTITDTSGDASELLLTGLGAGLQSFPFASFAPTVGSGADFTDADSIVLLIEALANADLTIDFVSSGVVTPEPTSLALAVFALFGLAMTRRRRRRA